MSQVILQKNQWGSPSDSVMPWQTEVVEDRRFKRFLRHAVGLFLVVAILLPFFTVPDNAVKPVVKAREQYTRLIIAERVVAPPIIEKPKPLPVPIVKPVPTKKVKPKPIVEPKKIVKPKVKTQPVDLMKQARHKAATSGLLTFADDLPAMRESVDMSQVKRSNLTRGAAQAEVTERKLLASKAQSKVGGINNAALSQNTGGVALSAREMTLINAPSGTNMANSGQAAASDNRIESGRSAESIRRIMDTNKGGIFAIYNRVLRNDPSLSGKVLFRMVVEESGAISHVELLSSELVDQALVSKMLSRIKLINFDADSVEQTDVNY